jgi:hypothetical protein
MMCLVIFLDKIEGTSLCFIENSSYVFTDDAETEELDTTEKEDNRECRGVSWNGRDAK